MRYTASLGLVLLMGTVNAQWESVGGGILEGATYSTYLDTTESKLYLTGTMRYMFEDSLEVRAITYWKNGAWHKMRTGTTYNGNGAAPPAQAVIRYDTTMVAVGQFRKMDSIPDTKGAAQWYGGQWHSMGIDSADFLSPNPFALAVIDDTLHMMGAFAFVYGGDTIRSWATYDGTTWRKGDNVEVPFQVGAACKYQGDLYIGGNFTIAGGIKDIARRGNTGWAQLGQGLLGDPWVNDMVVYDGLLWVVGEFYQAAGNAASGLMAWDGNQWLEPFPMMDMFAQGRNLTVSDGKLYFTGAITVDGYPGEFTIGQYDGSQLCILGGPDVIADDIAATADTVYITCCSHLYCLNQGPQVNYFAKWPLNAPPDFCFDVEVGIGEGLNATTQPSLSPNPLITTALLHLPSDMSRPDALVWHDAVGRVVRTDAPHWQGNALLIERGGLPPGLYLLRYGAAPAHALRVVVH